MTIESGAVALEHFGAGTIVEDQETGRRGVIIPDDYSAPYSYGREAVVYDGADEGEAISTNLTAVGTYESHIVDPERCGRGAGELCCKYLALEGEHTYVCQRFAPQLRSSLKTAKTMKAQAIPRHLFPGCQDDIQEAIANSRSIE